MGSRVTALILAGSRGLDDPVARHAGQTHKAFVPVAGVPMLLRVLRTLRRSPSIDGIGLCIDPAVLDAVDGAIACELGDGVQLIAPGPTPSASVCRAFERTSITLPLLLTTADHPLLTPAMVEHFYANAPAAADVVVAVATETVIRRAYPDAVRTFYRFAGEGYSGCNMFLLRGPNAINAATFWSEMERHRKRPWRLVATVGPLTLFLFLIGRLSLDEAMRRLSRIVGANIQAMVVPFAEAAIDVDKPADLALVERILAHRA